MPFSKYTTQKPQKAKEEPKYKILRHFGKLTNEEGKWNKELNLISWNDAPPKFDIRSWKEDENGERQMMKGITLNEVEAAKLLALLQKIAEEE